MPRLISLRRFLFRTPLSLHGSENVTSTQLNTWNLYCQTTITTNLLDIIQFTFKLVNSQHYCRASECGFRPVLFSSVLRAPTPELQRHLFGFLFMSHWFALTRIRCWGCWVNTMWVDWQVVDWQCSGGCQVLVLWSMCTPFRV